MEHCGKHDIIHSGVCWNCEEQAMSPEEREAAYKNPEFLAKRGGAGIAAAAAQAHLVGVSKALSALTPEQLEKLVSLIQSHEVPAKPAEA